MIVEVFLHGKAEMTGWMHTEVCKHACEFHPIGVCNTRTIGTEEDFIPGLLVVY